MNTQNIGCIVYHFYLKIFSLRGMAYLGTTAMLLVGGLVYLGFIIKSLSSKSNVTYPQISWDSVAYAFGAIAFQVSNFQFGLIKEIGSHRVITSNANKSFINK